ncbi:MAG: hypothetical protein GY722_13020 [bacterium]|nr:hypothetical protein [bacterium]
MAEKGLSGPEMDGSIGQVDRRVKLCPEPSFRPVLLVNSLPCTGSIGRGLAKGVMSGHNDTLRFLTGLPRFLDVESALLNGQSTFEATFNDRPRVRSSGTESPVAAALLLTCAADDEGRLPSQPPRGGWEMP